MYIHINKGYVYNGNSYLYTGTLHGDYKLLYTYVELLFQKHYFIVLTYVTLYCFLLLKITVLIRSDDPLLPLYINIQTNVWANRRTQQIRMFWRNYLTN